MSPLVVNLPRCLQSGQRSWLGRSPTWWIPLVPGGPLLHTPDWHCHHSESKSTHRHQYQTSDLMHMLPKKAKKFISAGQILEMNARVNVLPQNFLAHV